MRTEAHSVVRNLAKFGQAENLITPRIGEYGTVPGHEFVQARQVFADQFMSRAKIKDG